MKKIGRGWGVMQYKILVVDDEKEIADLVTLYLKSEGFLVFEY